MIDAIIVDDEKKAITALKNDLETYCPEVKVKAAFTRAADALDYLESNNPHVIFLDIELPVMNGFDFVAAMQKPLRSQIIFVTAYNEFALRAFRVDALDYILKPVEPEELQRVVQKVANHMQTDGVKQELKISPVPVTTGGTKTKIALPVNNGYHLVEPDHIIYCKATGSYTQVVLDNDKNFLISKNLSRTQDLLPTDSFERVHQSYLINLNHIKKFRKGESSEAVMVNDDVIKVSRQHKERLAQKLGIQ